MQPDFRLDGWTIRKIKGFQAEFGQKPGWMALKNGWTVSKTGGWKNENTDYQCERRWL